MRVKFNIANFIFRYFSIHHSQAITKLAQWQLRNLTACSASCGGGWQTGKIACVKEQEIVDDSECFDLKVPAVKTSCNTFPCKTP